MLHNRMEKRARIAANAIRLELSPASMAIAGTSMIVLAANETIESFCAGLTPVDQGRSLHRASHKVCDIVVLKIFQTHTGPAKASGASISYPCGIEKAISG